MLTNMRQAAAVTAMNLRAIPARRMASLVIVVGIGGVVAVLVAVLAMAEGFRATLADTGRDDRVIVLRGGASNELASWITRETVPVILDSAGVLRDGDGRAVASAEIFLVADLPRRATGTDANVTVRGVGEMVDRVRPEVRVVQGRMFTPGRRELIAGRGAHDQFLGLDIGQEVELRESVWTVVGLFEAGGNVHESEVWGDADTIAAAYRRTAYQSITALLESADAFDGFREAVAGNPQLGQGVHRESTYFSGQSERLTTLIHVLGYAVAGIMAIGALFGALNTMYAAVSARTVEIATLRAIGFGATPVVVSVLVEALLLALVGGIAGGALAYVFFNGFTVSTLNFQTFTQVAFAFRVTPPLLVQGIVLACLIGVLGGLLPALKAARQPVAQALRTA